MKAKRTLGLIAVLLTAGLGAQDPAPEPLPSVTLPAPLERVLRDYAQAWQARDAEALAALFTEDGFVLSGGRPPIRGRDAIREHYRGKGGPLSLRALAFGAGGDVGFVIGGYGRSREAPDSGKFTLTLRRVQGRWLIVSDMDSGNTGADPPEGDADQIVQLVEEFLAGASRNDAEVHDRFWADDLIYTSSSGQRRGKAEIMEGVRSAPDPQPGEPQVVYTAEDLRVQQYGHLAVVAFRLVTTAEVEGKTEVRQFLNSGTFLRRGGQWRVVNWQATRMAPQPAN